MLVVLNSYRFMLVSVVKHVPHGLHGIKISKDLDLSIVIGIFGSANQSPNGHYS